MTLAGWDWEPPIDKTPAPIVNDCKFEQPKKAEFPMLVTLLGMVTEVKEEQSAKALPPMLVTLFGMVTEVREEQT